MMGSRKLVRDVLLSHQLNFLRQGRQAAGRMPSRLTSNGSLVNRRFSIFNEFSKQVKGEAEGNQEFQQSFKELNNKVGEIKEDLKSRTKETTERLYKHADDLWAEAEATKKKVSASAKEKISAATDEVKETLGFGKKEPSGSTSYSANFRNATDVEFHTSRRTQDSQGAESSNFEKSAGKSETLFGQLKTVVTSASSKLSSAVQKLEEAKVIDLAKKGYSVVKDELTGSPAKRRRMQYASTSVSNEERSTRKDIVLVPSKQSIWGKKWVAFKEKMRGHPIFKRVSGLSEPVVTKGQELAEDMREQWETSDNPVVHKIQESVRGCLPIDCLASLLPLPAPNQKKGKIIVRPSEFIFSIPPC